MALRTWQAVMDEMATHGIPSTQARCARGFRSKAYHPIRNRPLVQTTGEDLLTVILRGRWGRQERIAALRFSRVSAKSVQQPRFKGQIYCIIVRADR
jgi:hypothetical protein